MSVTFSVYQCLGSFWCINIKGCVIQCLAEQKLGTGHGQNLKNETRAEQKPHLAAWLKIILRYKIMGSQAG